MSLISLFVDLGSDRNPDPELGRELGRWLDSLLQKHPRAVVYGILGVLVVVPTLMVGSLLLSGPSIKPATFVTAKSSTPTSPAPAVAPAPARPAAPADLVISAPPAGTRLPPLPTWTGSSGRAPLALGVADARRVVQSHATHVQKRGESDLEYWTVRQMQANNPNLKAEAEPGDR